MSDSSPAPAVGRDAPVREPPALRSLSLREALQAQVSACAEEFKAYAPRLRVRHAVYDGAWVVGVQVGGRLEGGLAYSRLDFELRVEPDSDRAELVRRCTVRNRDEPRATFDVSLDEDGRRRLEGFVEAGFLEFARRYFDES